MTVLAANTFGSASPTPAKRSLLDRLWPFSGGRVEHAFFGSLKRWRNGNYLRGRVEFGPVSQPVWLVIHAGEAGPSHLQEKVYAEVEKHYLELLPRVLKALFAEYQKVRHNQPHVRWPEVAKSTELLKIIPLDAIWLEQGPGHPFVLSFQSELDKDHEFHVFFRDGKLENVAFEH